MTYKSFDSSKRKLNKINNNSISNENELDKIKQLKNKTINVNFIENVYKYEGTYQNLNSDINQINFNLNNFPESFVCFIKPIIILKFGEGYSSEDIDELKIIKLLKEISEKGNSQYDYQLQIFIEAIKNEEKQEMPIFYKINLIIANERLFSNG